MVSSATATITNARREISRVLRRYGLGWFDVAPDIDQDIWNRTAPTARKIRKNLFRSRYPRLYAETRRKKISPRIS